MKSKITNSPHSKTPVERELEAAGLRLPQDGVSLDWHKVQWYYDFLLANRDFFSKADEQRILSRHLYESLWLAQTLASTAIVSRETRVLDAGSGPGLPGFLVACLKDAPPTTLADSSRRRLGRLEQARPPVEGLEFLYARLEEDRRARFDVVTIRALIPFPFCVELVAGVTKPNGLIVYAAAGGEIGNGQQGEAQSQTFEPRLTRGAASATNTLSDTGAARGPSAREADFLKKLGFVPRETIAAPELALLGQRSFYVLEKTGKTPPAFPRSWTLIKQAISQWEK